jgi:hypothetical protein
LARGLSRTEKKTIKRDKDVLEIREKGVGGNENDNTSRMTDKNKHKE